MNIKTQQLMQRIVKVVNGRFSYPAACNLYEELLASENTSAEDIVRTLKTDPITCTSIFKYANSPIYGLTNQVSDLSSAFVVLGAQRVKSILYQDMANKLASVFDISEDRLQLFWRKSLINAISAKLIAKKVIPKQAETLFVCGLVKLIGELPIMYLQKDKHTNDFGDKSFPWQHHKIAYGFTYNQLSGVLLKSWGFPAKNIIPIEQSHSDQLNIINKSVQVIQASSILSLPYIYDGRYNMRGLFGHDKIYQLGIKEGDLFTIFDHASALADEMLPFMLNNRPSKGNKEPALKVV